MRFETMDDLESFLRCNKQYILDSGTQGVCYKIEDNVYKIFYQYYDDDCDIMLSYSGDDIMQFSSFINNTYVFPSDLIMVGNEVVGYITKYVQGVSLFKVNPLKINLDKFQLFLELAMSDIRKISDNGVVSYDVMYNILYGRDGFKVIDTLEYSYSDIDRVELYNINYTRFIYEVRLFLIDGLFDKFINGNSVLYNLCYDNQASFLEFVKEFRKRLSENEGYLISSLGEANKSMSRVEGKRLRYMRG